MSILFGYYWNTEFSLVGIPFFSFVLLFCKRCVYVFDFCILNWLFSGSVGISLAGRVICFLCVWLRCVECRAGTIYLRASLKWMAGLYGFFFLSGCVVAGTVRLKWWRGWSCFTAFFSLLLFLGGLMSAVGFLCLFFDILRWICGFFVRFCVLKVIDFQ